MTYVPLCLISWDWFTDFRGIVVGVVSGAIGGRLSDAALGCLRLAQGSGWQDE